jgi:L-ascorbate metabolism protein UlaG (beta-lactamase superfamily)
MMRRALVVLLLASGLVYAGLEATGRPATVPTAPSPATWSTSDLNVAWLGHASVLVGFGGTMILTDPAFFERIGVAIGPLTIGPRRLVEAALRPEDLPPLDAVVISHAHMDSLDLPSLRAVAGAPLLVMPPRTRDLVENLGFARAVELGWGETVAAGGVTIEAVEVKHWGKRWPWERWRGYNGYLFTKGDTTVLFASDTAYTPALGRLGRGRTISAAIIGNGAYDPWIRNHASPEQVWRMFTESGARALIPIHWDTFRLGKEPLGNALARLLTAAGPEAARIVVRRIGETWTAPCCAGGGPG